MVKRRIKEVSTVTANNGSFFDCEELIWKAKSIQVSVDNGASKSEVVST